MNLPTLVSLTVETGPQGTFEVSTVDVPRTGEETVIFWLDGSGNSSMPLPTREAALTLIREGRAQTIQQVLDSI